MPRTLMAYLRLYTPYRLGFGAMGRQPNIYQLLARQCRAGKHEISTNTLVFLRQSGELIGGKALGEKAVGGTG